MADGLYFDKTEGERGIKTVSSMNDILHFSIKMRKQKCNERVQTPFLI